MPADDVYLAMVALNDPATLAQAASGDWSGLGELSLTDDERVLVEGLIEEDAAGDVEGFAGGARFAAIRHTSARVSPQVILAYPPSNYRFSSWFTINGMTCAGGTCCKGKCY